MRSKRYVTVFQTTFTPSSFAELLSGSYSELPLNEEIDSLTDVHVALTDSAEQQQPTIDHHQQQHQQQQQNDGGSGLQLPSFQETYAASGVGFKMDEDYGPPTTAAAAVTMTAASVGYHQQQHHSHLHHHHQQQHQHHQQQPAHHQLLHQQHHVQQQHQQQQQQLNGGQQHQQHHHHGPAAPPSTPLIHFDYHFQHFPGALPPSQQPPDSPTADQGVTASVFEPMLDQVQVVMSPKQHHQQHHHHQQQHQHQQQQQQLVAVNHQHHHQQQQQQSLQVSQPPPTPRPTATSLMIDTATEQLQHVVNNAAMVEARSPRTSSVSAVLALRAATDPSTR